MLDTEVPVLERFSIEQPFGSNRGGRVEFKRAQGKKESKEEEVNISRCSTKEKKLPVSYSNGQ